MDSNLLAMGDSHGDACCDGSKVAPMNARLIGGMGADERGRLLHGCTVLVVEDDPPQRSFLESVLTDHGARALAAGNGSEALRIIECDKVDLILSEIAMAEMTGYELLRKVRALEAQSEKKIEPIPAIAVTALAGPALRQEVLEAGFALYVSKPINVDELMGAVALVAGPICS
jgi:CheY-like chemotaxis protein